MSNEYTISGQWWRYIHKAETAASSRIDAGKRAKSWYRGAKEMFADEFKDWKGELVRGNLWQRDYDILKDSLWADDPKFSISCDIEGFEASCACIEALVLKVWNETSAFEEMDVVFGEALFENISWIALDYDRDRMIPSLRWVDGFVAVDPASKGMVRRANWVAEVIERPLIDVYTDTTIPEPKREEIVKKHTKEGAQFDPEVRIKMAYIWSKRGAEFWKPGKLTDRKKIVICDKIDDPLIIEDWPWPFIDADRFPLYMLRLRHIPKEMDGVTLFELLESLFKHYSWAASFNLADAKRTATKKILTNDQVITDADERSKLESGKHLEFITISGDPKLAAQTLDFGQGSDVVYRTAELAKQLHDEQSGITDVVRGQSEGGRQTAEEVRTLKSNASIVFQGIAKRLTRFSNEVIKDFVLACLYYIPAWSRIVGADGNLHTKIKNTQTGLLQDALVDPAEVDNNFVPIAGRVAKPGVDAFVGPARAMHWPEYEIDQLKRDFSFTIEAGSARADAMIDEQRNSLAILQQLGPIYQQMGLIPQLFELIKRFVVSFRPKDPYKMLPPPDVVWQLQQAQQWNQARELAMNLMQQMQSPTGGAQMPTETMQKFGRHPEQPMGGSPNDAGGLEQPEQQME